MRRELPVQFREGPGVQLPRATRLVILARYQGPRLTAWVESILEGWLGLQINRDKTRLVNLMAEDARLNFLGYQFRYARSDYRPERRYLRLEPSAKALARERETLRQMTGPVVCRLPIRRLVFELNRHLKGWREYFRLGYPQRAFRKIGWYTRERLVRHLRRRSQRPFRPPEGTTWYRHLLDLGLVPM